MKKIFLLLAAFLACSSILAQENIALGKKASASTEIDNNNTAGKAVDGNTTGTRWESEHGLDEQWFELDLEGVYVISSIDIYWEGASAETYDVKVSPDGNDWQTIESVTNTQGKRTDNIDGKQSVARYIRLDLHTRTTGYGFSIYEMEVFGRPQDVEQVATSMEISPKDVLLVPQVPEQVKVLSLNNSLIDYNDQNLTFGEIAKAMGKTATWTKHTLLGQSLATHYDEGEGLNANGEPSAKMMVRSEAWTHIILQEHSSLPVDDPDGFFESVSLWKDYIRENCPNPNAVIIVAMNWAYNDWDTFKSKSEDLYESYMDVASGLGITICPVGDAYEMIFDEEGQEVCATMYSDNRHPTAKASYLAACMEYGLIFGEDVTNVTYVPGGVTTEDAQMMRQYAQASLDTFENVVNHTDGTVKFSFKLYDQYNLPMESSEDAQWSADKGSIDNGTFTCNGELGVYEISATFGGFGDKATVTVAEAEEIIKEEAFAEVSSENTYEEDFDEIGTSATAALPDGWRIDKQLGSPRTLGIFSLAGSNTEQQGGNNMASNAKNGIYNFGAGDAATATDRAIGGLSTGIAGGTRCTNVYLKIRNTGADAQSLNISYNVEKYRKGANSAGFYVKMYYSQDGNEWNEAPEDFYTFFEKDNATEGYDATPGDTKPVSSTLEYDFANGSDLYLAWNITVAEGTDAQAAQALGIDDVKITLTAVPTAIKEQDGNGISINYAGGLITVSSDKETESTILNTAGQVEVQAGNAREISVSNLADGVHILNVKTSDGNTTVKFLK